MEIDETDARQLEPKLEPGPEPAEGWGGKRQRHFVLQLNGQRVEIQIEGDAGSESLTVWSHTGDIEPVHECDNLVRLNVRRAR